MARYAYDAWVNVLAADVAVSDLADNRYLFQVREYSWATGLYNFRLRWYDPATGRWLSKNPIGISGGLNLYVFCGNEPVNYVDPWGLECEEGKSFFCRLKGNYSSTLNDLYGDYLIWADNLGLWGLGASVTTLATGVGPNILSTVADKMAREQIETGMLAGALEGGDIIARQKAAAAGTRIAGRTAGKRAALTAVGKVSGVVTAGATAYSLTARINSGVRALFKTIRDR